MANEGTIEQLKLIISAENKADVADIKKLIDALSKLEEITKNFKAVNVDNITKPLEEISKSFGLKDISAEMKRQTQAFQEFFNTFAKTSSSFANKVSSITDELQAFKNLDLEENIQSSMRAIASLSKGLVALSAINVGNISTKIQEIINGFEPLKTLNIEESIQTTMRSFYSFANAFKVIEDINSQTVYAKLNSISRILEDFSQRMSKTQNISEYVAGISSFIKAMNKVEKIEADNITSKLNKIATALVPLTNEMLRAGESAKHYALALAEVNKISSKVGTYTKQASNGFGGMITRLKHLGIAYLSIRRAFRFVADAFFQAGAWFENLNLFEVTFKNASKEALNFALTLNEAFGLGINNLVKYMGLFKQMSSAIGIADETANKLAETLTAVALDISSLYNVQLETVMADLRSMQAGQTKPIRKYGFDTTMQSMDQLLEQMGILQSSKALGQQEKYLLRIILVLRQSVNAWGNMSREINNISTQLQVLRGSLDNFKLAIGNAFAEPIRRVLILVNGLIMAITEVINAFAPLKTETGLGEAISNIEQFNDDLEETNKKLNQLSFDKFEALNRADTGVDTSVLMDQLTEMFDIEYKRYFDAFNAGMAGINNQAIAIKDTILDWVFPFNKWSDETQTLIKDFSRINPILALITSSMTILIGFQIVSFIKSIDLATKGLGLSLKFLFSPIGIILLLLGALYLTNKDVRNSINSIVKVILDVLGVIFQLIGGIITFLDKLGILTAVIWVVLGALIAYKIATSTLVLANTLLAMSYITKLIPALNAGLVPAIISAKTAIIKLTTTIITSFVSAMQVAIVAVVKFIITMITSFVSAIATAIISIISFVITIISALVPAIISATVAVWAFTVALLANPIGAIIAVIVILIGFIIAIALNWNKVTKIIKDSLEHIGNFFKAYFKLIINLWINIGNIVISVVNLILSAIETMINFWISGLNEIIKLANKIPAINIPLIGKVRLQIPKIPQYRKDGGSFDLRGGTAIGVIGEHGKAERVTSDNAGRVNIETQETTENAMYNALARWFSANPFPAPQINLPSGVSPKDFYMTTTTDMIKVLNTQGYKIVKGAK